MDNKVDWNKVTTMKVEPDDIVKVYLDSEKTTTDNMVETFKAIKEIFPNNTVMGVTNGIDIISEKQTNYNKIKNMSIENMAEFISNNATNNFCDLICNGECRALGTLNKPADDICKEIIRNWLNSTVNEC